jgi:hypothetical protein
VAFAQGGLLGHNVAVGVFPHAFSGIQDATTFGAGFFILLAMTRHMPVYNCMPLADMS